MSITSFRWWITFVIVVIFLSFVTLGCSGGGVPFIPGTGDGVIPGTGPATNPGGRDTPDPPPDELPPPPPDHNLFGFAGIHFDTGTNAFVVDRSPDIHYNLTNELSEPLCPDCIVIETIEVDEVNNIVKLLITLRNPTNETYYDIRGIMITNETYVSIVNPDGYITLFDDGGDIEWNPYYAYCLENEDRSFESDFVSKRFWYIKYTSGESMDFTLVVEGSNPGHCEDVARILVDVSDDTYLTPWEQGGNIELAVDDWQWDISAVHLHIPDLNIEVPFVEGELSQYTLDWDSIGYPVTGTYEFYAEAWSPNPDQLAVRQYGTITVHPDEEGFYEGLPAGYSFRGINPTRDYRSSHVGPGTLQNIVFKGHELTNWDWYISYGHSLRVSETNNWYFIYEDSHSWHSGGYPDSGGSYSALEIVRFNHDFNPVGFKAGGYDTVLFNDCLTTYWDTSSSSYQGPYHSSWHSHHVAKYTPTLEKITSVGGETEIHTSPPYSISGEPLIGYNSIALSGDRMLTIEGMITGVDNQGYPSEKIYRVAIRNTADLEILTVNDQLNLDDRYTLFASAAPDGRIYIVNGDRLICTDWALEPLWYYYGNDTRKPAMVNPQGVVFLVSEGAITALSPNGEELWEKDFELKSDPASFQNGDLIFVTADNELLRLDYVTGDIVWGAWLTYGGDIRNVIVDAEERIYLAGDEAYIFSSEGELIDSASMDVVGPGRNSNTVLAPNRTLGVVRSFSQYFFDIVRFY